MRNMFYRAALAPLLLLTTLPAQAADWVLDSATSKVVFQYSYSGTPYQGAFTNIEGTFDIDPANPAACSFTVSINIEDIAIDDAETLSYLLDVEMFDVDQFPTAKFTAEKCRLDSTGAFVSDGMLTIRDQTHPVSFPFNLEVTTAGGKIGFHMTSEVTIQRLAFGVGQGYLANTSAIPNDVIVSIDVHAVQQ
ncbi:MAG: YceI family protein [Gammaproteobacteria bacterium]|nr:YceI family protein [Gammaproteobacteria bacterium]MDP2141831.1 YceI family protein [Gammaproteobacteria bacterium]MDP2348322.1 YceI family protein [Gammaproteobacteria bacterium]